MPWLVSIMQYLCLKTKRFKYLLMVLQKKIEHKIKYFKINGACFIFWKKALLDNLVIYINVSQHPTLPWVFNWLHI